MDYEKKYNEALERARALWREAIEKEYVDDYLKDYETIFPELRESEDERIRKFLKDYAIEMIAGLESDISISVYDGVKGHDPDAEEELEKWRKARAWLEKQKEQKPAGWSEEDQLNLNWVIAILNGEPCDLDIHLESLISWLKSLRPSWKPSEEHLSALLAVFNDPNNIGSQTCQLALTDLYEQLKKL